MTNIDIFKSEKEIVNSLKNKDTSKCLAWCNENKSKLKKINVRPVFQLINSNILKTYKLLMIYCTL
jgi:macrophage erythroblast attacher